MQVDPEYLREHYASLSNKALLTIDRAALVEIAQTCYDDELRRRNLAPLGQARRSDTTEIVSKLSDPPDGDAEVDVKSPAAGDKPGGLEEAVQVQSWIVLPGNQAAPNAEIARAVLADAGIPCYLEMVEIPDDGIVVDPMYEWRLMVPGKLNFRATSVLEREIINPEFEAEWKTHLEALSDKELRDMNPKITFCGLMDRIERVTRAYDEEIARRRRKSELANADSEPRP